LADFGIQRLFLVSISKENFKRWQAETLNAVVGKDRYQIIAAYMERLYGNIVGRALRELPYESNASVDYSSLTKYSKENIWVNEPLQTLIERIEKSFDTMPGFIS
jgi:predicted RNA-binding protein